jgi:alpha-galactosidase
MSYRKDLPGFSQPTEGMWDGWQRINFETKKGGIFGVFRQGALEDTRKIFLTDLLENSNYTIKEAPTGKMVFKGSGKEIIENGISVSIDENYGGKIFEIAVN